VWNLQDWGQRQHWLLGALPNAFVLFYHPPPPAASRAFCFDRNFHQRATQKIKPKGAGNYMYSPAIKKPTVQQAKLDWIVRKLTLSLHSNRGVRVLKIYEIREAAGYEENATRELSRHLKLLLDLWSRITRV